MKIINARLRGQTELFSLSVAQGLITHITPQTAALSANLPEYEEAIDAAGNLLSAPFVEPHIHLDAVLTAGQPSWNMSGTAFT